jgi:hypothetical protein
MKTFFRSILAVVALAVAAPALAATLYISEFGNYAPSTLPAAFAPAITMQTVAVSGTSAQSNAFNAQTVLIRLFADASMCVVVGSTNPTATSSSQPMAANQVEYFLVRPGDKVAAVTCTP